jgi:hypothetical protein
VAKYERQLTGDVDELIAHVDQAIPMTSSTGQIESAGDYTIGDARMVVRVYERYSAMGGNRVSLSVSVLAVGEQLEVCAITSGGSQAMFWKMNTFGEESFLSKAVQAIEGWAAAHP